MRPVFPSRITKNPAPKTLTGDGSVEGVPAMGQRRCPRRAGQRVIRNYHAPAGHDLSLVGLESPL
jgi:hypothetical protein